MAVTGATHLVRTVLGMGPVSTDAGVVTVAERSGDRSSDRSAEPVVSVSDLRVTFERGGRSVRAVRGVDLHVEQGEILGLVGESGSGKSVLGLALLGLLPTEPPPEVSGSAIVCGLDMVSAS